MNLVELNHRIDLSFANTLPPGPHQLVPALAYRHLEAEGIERLLRGRKWQEVSHRWLKQNYAGDSSAILAFLSDVAFHYYYPAFLKITLNDFAEADVTAYSSAYCFVDPSQEKAGPEGLVARELRRQNLFSTTQLEIIRDVFAFTIQSLDHKDDDLQWTEDLIRRRLETGKW